MKKVIKRSGEHVDFDERRIRESLLSCFDACDHDFDERIYDEVISKCNMIMDDTSIEDIQDIIEQTLFSNGLFSEARSYITYRNERTSARMKRVKHPKLISAYIHKSKYARGNETFPETVARVMNMHRKTLKDTILKKDYNLGSDSDLSLGSDSDLSLGSDVKDYNLGSDVKDYNLGSDVKDYNLGSDVKISDILNKIEELILEKKILPSMRSLQFAGPALLSQNERMFNCTGMLMDKVRRFYDLTYLLLCGCGCGINVAFEHVWKLPPILKINSDTVTHYTIPDTIEGWASSIDLLIKSYMETGVYCEMNYSQIRPCGSALYKTGGIAPGHFPLKTAIENIRKILDGCAGRCLKPIEVFDICCYIASCVLSGGTRRSSLMTLFSAHDMEMMYAKSTGNFDPLRGIGIQRCNSNISVICLRDDVESPNIIRKILKENMYGEPGFVILDSIYGCVNPCAEIKFDSLVGIGYCNLTSVNLAKCSSSSEAINLCKYASYLATIQTLYSSCIDADTSNFYNIGVSLDGMMDNTSIAFDPSVLSAMRSSVISANAELSSLLGIPSAKRHTCIKPSGTASLLFETSSGIHPHHARRYIRRVIFNKEEPYGKLMASVNPSLIEKRSESDFCIMFPMETLGLTREDVRRTFIEQYYLPVAKNYVNQAISCSIEIEPGWLDEVIGIIIENLKYITTMSFIPIIIDSLYPFAPRQEVTDEEWNKLYCVPVDYSKIDTEIFRKFDTECSGTKCDL